MPFDTPQQEHEHNQIMALHLMTRAEVLAQRIQLLDIEVEGDHLAVQVRGLVLEAFWRGVESAESFGNDLRLSSAVHKST